MFRVGADVAGDHIHELPLRLPDLVVEPSYYIALRNGKIVLHEMMLESKRGVRTLVVDLQKLAAIVTINLRFEYQDVGNSTRHDLHACSPAIFRTANSWRIVRR